MDVKDFFNKAFCQRFAVFWDPKGPIASSHLLPIIRLKADRVLDEEHINYITSNETLLLQAGLSMGERTQMFSSKFTDKKLSKTTLYRLYKKHGIKRKRILVEKTISDYQKLHFNENKENVIKGLNHAKEADLPVVYLDEIVFSKSSIKRETWMNKNVNFSTDQENFYCGYKAVIVAVNS